jgi:predicted membrane protein
MSDNEKRINPAILNGSALILVGTLLLLDQLNIITLYFWALILFVFGLLKFLQSHDRNGRVWGLLLAAAGVLVELDRMHYLQLRLSGTWPVFVIFAGILLIWRAYQDVPDVGATDASPHLNVLAVLGGGEYRIRSKNFRGGDLVAFMGGFEVDFREAEIEGDTAVITINALMGGGVLRIPETWAVSMQVTAFMGGHSLKAREGSQTTKTLIVKGFAIMGGVEIRN